MDMPRLLLVGDLERDEFRLATQGIASLCRLVHTSHLEAAFEHLAGSADPPDVIALAQARPGQFAVETVDALRKQAPLARVVGLLGAWCEGETRTGTPWPGVVRLYWHQWAARLAQELAWLARGHCPTWGLPATCGDDERLLWADSLPHNDRPGLVAIDSASAEMGEFLGSALSARGLGVVWSWRDGTLQARGVSAVVWDCPGSLDAGQLARLACTAAQYPAAGLIALVGFPRGEDALSALSAGAAAVISKPLLLADLFWQLDQLGLDARSSLRR